MATRSWLPLGAHRPRPLQSRAWGGNRKPSSRPPIAARFATSLLDESVLEAGDPAADPEVLLVRKTLTGLTEHELLLALNNNDESELQSFHGFGPRVAQKIIEFRAKERFFSSLDELVRVPLIGPTRFRKLVGRESQFYTLSLHSTLRRPTQVAITVGNLRPLLWPAPAVPRVFLGQPHNEQSEQELSQQNGWFLHVRRTGRHLLFIHTDSHLVKGWAEHLLRALPHTVRRILRYQL